MSTDTEILRQLSSGERSPADPDLQEGMASDDPAHGGVESEAAIPDEDLLLDISKLPTDEGPSGSDSGNLSVWYGETNIVDSEAEQPVHRKPTEEEPVPLLEEAPPEEAPDTDVPSVPAGILQQVMEEQGHVRAQEADQQEAKARAEAEKQSVKPGEISRINVNILKYILEEENAEAAADRAALRPAAARRPTPADEFPDPARPRGEPRILGTPNRNADRPSPSSADGPLVVEGAGRNFVLEEVKPAKSVGEQTFCQRNALPWAAIAGALRASKNLDQSSSREEKEPAGEEQDAGTDSSQAPATPAAVEGQAGIAASQGGKSKVFRFHPDLAQLEEALRDSSELPSVGTGLPPKARPAVSTILLAVERLGSYSRVMSHHFERAQWRVELGEGVDKSLQVASPEKISLVIADTKIKGFFELIETLKVNQSTNHIPVIAVSSGDLDFSSQQELRVLPDEELVEPFEMGTLLRNADWELARAAKTGVIFDQRVHLTLPTRLEKLEDAKNVMERLLRQSGMDREDQFAFLAAFREALANAARHGNGNRPATTIEALYLLDREKATIAVKDEGVGFDLEPYCDRNGVVKRVELLKERLQAEDLGELGIMLLAQSADRVQYNETGNMVTLAKRLKPREEDEAPVGRSDSSAARQDPSGNEVVQAHLTQQNLISNFLREADG